jgi:hypothetical protein
VCSVLNVSRLTLSAVCAGHAAAEPAKPGPIMGRLRSGVPLVRAHPQTGCCTICAALLSLQACCSHACMCHARIRSPACVCNRRRCIDFNANFGQVELRAANPAAGAAAAAAAPVTQRRGPPPAPPPLANCAPLTGRFRAHWQVRCHGIDSLQGAMACCQSRSARECGLCCRLDLGSPVC